MLNEAIEIAEKQHRKAIEMTYDCTCTIIEYKSVKDQETKVTKKQEVIILEGQECGISFSKVSSTNPTESVSMVSQTITLFIAPEILVNPGSKIIIKDRFQNETEYKSSGKPAIYLSHQEIILELVGNA